MPIKISKTKCECDGTTVQTNTYHGHARRKPPKDPKLRTPAEQRLAAGKRKQAKAHGIEDRMLILCMSGGEAQLLDDCFENEQTARDTHYHCLSSKEEVDLQLSLSSNQADGVLNSEALSRESLAKNTATQIADHLEADKLDGARDAQRELEEDSDEDEPDQPTHQAALAEPVTAKTDTEKAETTNAPRTKSKSNPTVSAPAPEAIIEEVTEVSTRRNANSSTPLQKPKARSYASTTTGTIYVRSTTDRRRLFDRLYDSLLDFVSVDGLHERQDAIRQVWTRTGTYSASTIDGTVVRSYEKYIDVFHILDMREAREVEYSPAVLKALMQTAQTVRVLRPTLTFYENALNRLQSMMYNIAGSTKLSEGARTGTLGMAFNAIILRDVELISMTEQLPTRAVIRPRQFAFEEADPISGSSGAGAVYIYASEEVPKVPREPVEGVKLTRPWFDVHGDTIGSGGKDVKAKQPARTFWANILPAVRVLDAHDDHQLAKATQRLTTQKPGVNVAELAANQRKLTETHAYKDFVQQMNVHIATNISDEAFLDLYLQCLLHYADPHAKRDLRVQAYDLMSELRGGFEISEPESKGRKTADVHRRREQWELLLNKDPAELTSVERKKLKNCTQIKNGVATFKHSAGFTVQYKGKFNEFAKANKLLRAIGDLGVSASLNTFRSSAHIKDALAREPFVFRHAAKSCLLTFVKSATQDALEEALRLIIECENEGHDFIMCYHSDDSIIAWRDEAGWHRANMDISNCDASHTEALFDATVDFFGIPGQAEHVKKGLEQLGRDAVVTRPSDRRQQAVMSFDTRRLYSGSGFTTVCNNAAELLMAIAIVTNSGPIPERTRVAGYEVTLEDCTARVERLQFLKNSPVFCHETQSYVPVTNLGTVLRSVGTCKGRLDEVVPGRHSLATKARNFTGSVLKGYNAHVSIPLLTQLRAAPVARMKREVPTHMTEYDYKLIGNGTVQRHLRSTDYLDRYDLSDTEIDELTHILSSWDIGEHPWCTAIDKVLTLDYGYGLIPEGEPFEAGAQQ